MVVRLGLRLGAVCVVGVLLGVFTPPLVFAQAASAGGGSLGQCERMTVRTPDGTVRGRLCVPRRGTDRVQVLVHGATYTGSYWRGLNRFEELSYVREAVADGYATFSYDRLGSGASDRPRGATLTVADAAQTLHAVVRRMGGSFDDVTVVGHSLGSIIAVDWADDFDDAGDRLVVTGFTHVPAVDPVALPAVVAGLLVPAPAADLRRDYDDPTYFTTVPGVRDEFFYSAAANPAVVAYDEHVKSVISGGQVATGGPKLLPVLGDGADVEMPVLVVMGKRDAIFCDRLVLSCTEGSIRATESTFYRDAESLTVEVVPRAGHNLALHPSVSRSQDTIASWVDRVSG